MNVTNIRFAGLGGMGVLKAAQVLSEVAFQSGCDVKKAEAHGMSQRGGSVSSDVRFGRSVLSPMIPDGEIDFLVVMAADQVEVHRADLKAGGRLITADSIASENLDGPKNLNMALMGALSRGLDFSGELWIAAIRRALPEKHWESNEKAFHLGRHDRNSCVDPSPLRGIITNRL